MIAFLDRENWKDQLVGRSMAVSGSAAHQICSDILAYSDLQSMPANENDSY